MQSKALRFSSFIEETLNVLVWQVGFVAICVDVDFADQTSENYHCCVRGALSRGSSGCFKGDPTHSTVIVC